MSSDWGYACFLLNIIIPGLGTMISAAKDENQPFRFDVLGLGICQLLTSPLLLFGWIWSINHGVAIYDIATKDEDKDTAPEDQMPAKQLVKHALVKLLYEFVGTYMIALIFICNNANTVMLFFGLWICNSFCIRTSGAHFNPIISLGFTLRKNTNGLPRKLAMFYILAQVAGALLAGITSLWMLTEVKPVHPTTIKIVGHDDVDNTFRDMMAELLGSGCFVFFYLSQTEKKTVISQIETVQCFVLAAAYITARTLVRGNGAILCNYGVIMNPAIAIGIFFCSWFKDFGEAWKYIWLYPIFPVIGGVLAVFFFEFVYVKTDEMLKKHAEEGKDSSSNEDHDVPQVRDPEQDFNSPFDNGYPDN